MDTETQTDTMDISETDASPSAFAASRELSMCLRENKDAFGMIDSAIVNEEYTLRDDNNSPNGNVMSKSDLTYEDACSSPDQLDDAMNSNERLNIRDCSDDDNLKQLGRKVSEFITENRLSIQSNHSENGNNMHDTTSGRRGFVSVNSENEVTLIRCGGSNKKIVYKSKDDRCDDSWTDEEGEDTDYNYSLRRKRLVYAYKIKFYFTRSRCLNKALDFHSLKCVLQLCSSTDWSRCSCSKI